MIICWFNGPSRDQLIELTPPQSIEIGCNYIERRRAVNHVCAFDHEVVKAIKCLPGRQYHTRADSQHQGWNVIQDHMINGTNSGVLACWVASRQEPQPIYIIGCDWGVTDQSSDDHIYRKHGYRRKYTNNISRTAQRILKDREVHVVSDQDPDVPWPVISTSTFLSLTTNK